MTQYYKMSGLSLSNANTSTKVLLTLFLLTALGGLAVALLQYYDRAGISRKDAVEWVEGNEEDLNATTLKPAKTFRELLAITHDHAFSLPILMFVLLHLVALCTLSEKVKIALYVAGFLSIVGSLSGPWLVAYGGPSWTYLLLVSGCVMTGSMAFSICLCLFELWLAPPLRAWTRKDAPRAPDPMVGRR